MLKVNDLPKKQKQSIIAVLAYRFFVGLIFWYGIEQLFIQDISAEHVRIKSYTVMAFSTVFVLTNTVAGSFSDRYGRKLSLGIAALGQGLVVFLLGLADSELWYVLLSGAYAIPLVFASGADRALIYDSLQDAKHGDLYSSISAISPSAFLAGAATANVASGFIADAWGLDYTYFLSVISCALALLCVFYMNEPSRGVAKQESMMQKIDISLKTIRDSKELIMLTIMFVAVLTIGGMSNEFGQSQFLEFNDSARLMGIFWFVAAITMSFFSYLAGKTVHFAKYVVAAMCVVAGLMLVFDSWFGLGLVILLMSSVEAIIVYNDVYVNSEITSNIRNTVNSALYTLGSLMLVPIFYLTGYLSDDYSARAIIAVVSLVSSFIALWSLIGYTRIKGDKIET